MQDSSVEACFVLGARWLKLKSQCQDTIRVEYFFAVFDVLHASRMALFL
jgi:hypothetical protein